MEKREKLIKIVTYVAKDEKEFKSESECKDYEALLERIKYFVVRYNPNLDGEFTDFINLVVVCKSPIHEEIVRSFISERLNIKEGFCKSDGGEYFKTFSIKEFNDLRIDHCEGILFDNEDQREISRFIYKEFKYYYNYSKLCQKIN